jgi:hypothetical protein
MRISVGVTLACRRPTPHPAELIAALLLVGGVWTPAVAAVIGVMEGWRAAFQSGGWVSLLMATMTLALACIGAGTWSLDARALGWRRIDIPGGATRERGPRSGG